MTTRAATPFALVFTAGVIAALPCSAATSADPNPSSGRAPAEADRVSSGTIRARGISVFGRQGEPLPAATRVHSFTNERRVPVEWTIASDTNWAWIDGPQCGVLGAGATVEFVVGYDHERAASFRAGRHASRIRIIDRTTGLDLDDVDVDVTVLPLVVNGWTALAPSADSRMVYVSSTQGNDANTGLSPSAPKRTIEAGLALLRHGYPDWLNLRKGDAFSSLDMPDNGFRWMTSGRSADEPTVFTSYGPAGALRPRLVTRGKPALSVMGGAGTPDRVDHVAIVGIEFNCGRHDAGTQNPTAIRLQHPMRDVLIEDCRISRYSNAIVAQLTGGMLEDVRIRRNVIHDTYSGDGSHAQGIYCDEVDGLLLEENLVDHGGWTEIFRDADPADIFKHGVYIQGDARNVIAIGNIVTSASSHGIQLRSGGVAENNLFVRNAIGLLMAGDGTVRRNVFLDGRDISPTLPRRHALHIQNVPTGVHVERNVIGMSQASTSSKGIMLQPLVLGGGVALGIRNALLERNVMWSWGGEAVSIQSFGSTGAFFENVDLRYNDLQNLVDTESLIQHGAWDTIAQVDTLSNRFYASQAPSNAWAQVGTTNMTLQSYLQTIGDNTSVAQPVSYPQPSRTIETYQASLGGTPTLNAFVAEAKRQSREFWRPQYTAAAVNAYIRSGFGMTP